MNFTLAIRSLFKNKQGNLIKIVSLGLGLAVGMILITQALFELSYDNFYPDSENIYLISASYQIGSDPERKFPAVSGAIAPGLKAEIPQVVAATRFTYIGVDAVFFTEGRRRFTGSFILADSCLFDVIPRPMLVGDAKEVLSRPMYALVSDAVAQRMGGDVVGQIITMDNYPGRELVIGGVFETIPHNSSIEHDVIISLSSIGRFTWDGTQNWLGNDRYMGLVKLQAGTDADGLAPAIRRMQEKYQDIAKIEEQFGGQINYHLSPFSEYYSRSEGVKRKVRLLGWVAFALIFTAIMNYVLIVIATYIKRAREMAVYKSYGASRGNIAQLIYTEILTHLVAALVIAVLSIFLFRGTVEEVLGTSVTTLITAQSVFILGLIVLAIFGLTGLVPARLFSSIPAATAFRNARQSRRSWMLALLFVQLAASTFMVSLLVAIGLQYRFMLNDNPGYAFEQLAYCTVSGASASERQTALNRLAQLPDVEMAALAGSPLFEGASGNNVGIPGEDRDLFNMADLYGIDENYLTLMEIPIIEGKGFEQGVSTGQDMMVSHSFARRISEMRGWNESLVGTVLQVSEHGLCCVVGVYDDVRIGTIAGEDKRPSAMFYTPEQARTIFIRFHQLTGERMQKAIDVLQSAIPDKDIILTPYKDGLLKSYNETRLMRNTIMIGSIIALLLSLIGLLAYLRSEINRRTAEIAIRKVNGATIANVLSLFAKNILYLAIPALAIGALAAAYMTGKLMEDFSEKVTLGFPLFAACGLAVLAITLGILTAGCWRVATQNPVHALKTE